MAVNYEMLPNSRGTLVRSAEPDNAGSGVFRNLWNTSTENITEPECTAKGLGYSFILLGNGHSDCYFPCPPAYSVMEGNPRKCEQRPLVTEVVDYYAVLKSTLTTCAEKNGAIGNLVAQGTDPSTVPWPSDCPYPYAPEDEPYVPPLPESYSNPDPSGSAGNPATRITFLRDELDLIPKVSEYGILRDSPLVALLRGNPTYVDSHPEYLNEMMKLVPTFSWHVNFTQTDFEKLPDSIKCRFCQNPNIMYEDPSFISTVRSVLPELEITRGAPTVVPIRFKNCPLDVVTQQCNQTNASTIASGETRDCAMKHVAGGECDPACVNNGNCPPKERGFWDSFTDPFKDFGNGIADFAKGVGGVAGDLINTVGDIAGGLFGGVEFLWEYGEYIVIGGVALYVISFFRSDGSKGTIIVSAPAPAPAK